MEKKHRIGAVLRPYRGPGVSKIHLPICQKWNERPKTLKTKILKMRALIERTRRNLSTPRHNIWSDFYTAAFSEGDLNRFNAIHLLRKRVSKQILEASHFL